MTLELEAIEFKKELAELLGKYDAELEAYYDGDEGSVIELYMRNNEGLFMDLGKMIDKDLK